MIELEPGSYAKVLPLLDHVPFNSLFARVVVERKVAGRVFVDIDLTPSVCLVVHKYGMALLTGNNGIDSFNDDLALVLRRGPSEDLSAKWMLTYPGAWEQTISDLLVGDLVKVPDESFDETVQGDRKHILLTERVNFKFHEDQFPGIADIPDGFALRRVDAGIYARLSGTVVPQYFWDSDQDFLRDGMGFSLMRGEQPVSTCFSSFIVGNRLELGIETDPGFRRRGYSVCPATASIDHCLMKGVEPVWSCRKGNAGSFRLALKLGFQPQSYHPYYFLPGR